MRELCRALKNPDPHHTQNVLTAVKQGGYLCERRMIGKGDDAVSRLFAKPATTKAGTKVKVKSTAKKSKSKKTKAKKTVKKPTTVQGKKHEPASATQVETAA